jgi:hypothetical protein
MSTLTKTQNGIEVPLSQDEIDDFNAREKDHEQKMAAYEKIAYQDKRKEQYFLRGCTIEAMSVAIWEKIVENRPESADVLQLIRETVKTEIPKPGNV